MTQNFGYAYFLGIDPSIGSTETKLLMARTYTGSMSIAGNQGNLVIKKKDYSYYFAIPGGYLANLVDITHNGCTIDIVDSVPSDATNVVINNQ